jgi:hypothetical protein
MRAVEKTRADPTSSLEQQQALEQLHQQSSLEVLSRLQSKEADSGDDLHPQEENYPMSEEEYDPTPTRVDEHYEY